MGYWQRIRRIETDQGLDIRAIRAVDGELGTFKSTVLITVPNDMIDIVEGYTELELQSYVEQRCDIEKIEDGLVQTEYTS